MGELKESKQALGAEVIAGLQDFAPPTLLAQASRLNFSTRLFNLIVTNVPGPQFPLYLLGREMQEIVPVAFLPENHALAIAIMSYNGKVDFGLLADYDAMPDLDAFAGAPRGVARRAARGRAQGRQGDGASSNGGKKDGRPAVHGRKPPPRDAPDDSPFPWPSRSRVCSCPPRMRRRPTRSGTRARPRTACCSARPRSTRQRVPSFDGVPLDVDVTLPPTGDGPFPTIVMMHGWGGQQDSLRGHVDSAARYSNLFYAQQGYAVVNYSARGLGRSCGAPDSRTSPGCDAGWIHLADHRYEARDTQRLLGLLVDQGVAKADAIGVTGVSYGGIQSLNLARLRNRVRLPGRLVRGPGGARTGTPLKIKAAYARWPGSDLTNALQPNGRFLDFRTPEREREHPPGGVMKKSYNDGLYFTRQRERLLRARRAARSTPTSRPGRRSPTAASPPRADALAVGRELTGFHSWAGLPGPSAALLVQNGWTDDLFPAPEALRVYRTFTAAPGARHLAPARRPRPSARLQRPGAGQAHDSAGATVLRRVSEGRGHAAAPRQRAGLHPDVPGWRAGRGRASAPRTGSDCTRRPRRMRHRRPLRMSSRGGNPATAAGDRPDRAAAARRAATVPAERAKGHGRDPAALPKPFTMLGLPTVQAQDPDQGPWRLHRRAALGRAPRRAGAGVARRLQAQGQPAREAALPAVRERLAVRRGPHREARAARAATRTISARATSSSRSASRARG